MIRSRVLPFVRDCNKGEGATPNPPPPRFLTRLSSVIVFSCRDLMELRIHFVMYEFFGFANVFRGRGVNKIIW